MSSITNSLTSSPATTAYFTSSTTAAGSSSSFTDVSSDIPTSSAATLSGSLSTSFSSGASSRATASAILYSTLTNGPVIYTSGSVTYTKIPLYTIFTPPSGCSTNNYTSLSLSSNTPVFRQNPAAYDDATSLKCYPPLFALQVSARGSVFYSPAACPSGYSAASINAQNEASTSVCCPSGATLSQAIDILTTSMTSTFQSLFSACYSTATTTTTVTINGSTSIVGGPAVFRVPTIKVAWANTDLDAFTPASAPLLSTANTSSSAVSSSSSSGGGAFLIPYGSGSSTQDSSIGAIVGISVGSFLVFCIIVALIWFCVWRCRRAKRAKTASLPHSTEMGGLRSPETTTAARDPALTDTTASTQANTPMTELGSRDKYELGEPTPELGGAHKHELEAKDQKYTFGRQEMPGS